MIIDEDVEVFLEHFGKKGMRWGSRKAPQQGGDTKAQRRVKNKLAVGIGGAAGLLVSREIGGLLASKFNLPLNQLLVMGAGTVAGVALTRKYLNNKGDTPMSSLPKAK